MKKKLAVLLAAIMVFGVFAAAGCQANETPQGGSPTEAAGTAAEGATSAPDKEAPSEAAAGDDKVTIGYAVFNFTNPYYFGIMDGGNFAAEELGCEVIWKSCEGSIEEEIAIIENFIEQGVDVICMDPVDAKALVDTINKATEAGIPVVTFNNIIEDVDAYAYTPNSLSVGENVSELMCHYLGKKGSVAILQEQPGNNSSDTHEKGFRDVIAKYPDIKIVGEQVTNFDPDKALQITQTWLSTLDDLDAIICISGSSAASAAQAIKAEGKTDEIAIFSADGMNNEAILNGEQTGDSESYTLAAGYWNIRMCYDIAKDPSSWPKVTQYTPAVVSTNEILELCKTNGLEVDAPGLVTKDAEEHVALVAAGDPTKISLNWDEGHGPAK